MNTKIFLKNIIRPLEKKLHINIFLNNGEFKNSFNKNCHYINSGESCEDCVGCSKFNKNGRFICIRNQEEYYEILSALFNEIAHATLHNVHNHYEDNISFCLAEAEEFSKIMCKKLNFPHRECFKEQEDINIQSYYWEKYTEYCKENNLKVKYIRKNLINRITDEILGYNIDFKNALLGV